MLGVEGWRYLEAGVADGAGGTRRALVVRREVATQRAEVIAPCVLEKTCGFVRAFEQILEIGKGELEMAWRRGAIEGYENGQGPSRLFRPPLEPIVKDIVWQNTSSPKKIKVEVNLYYFGTSAVYSSETPASGK